MMKIYCVLFSVIFYWSAFGQMEYNDLKNRIEQQVIYSKNKEALSLINASIPHLNGIQKTEFEVTKMEILNELALVDEAFVISQKILSIPKLPVNLKLRTHLQRALIFETAMRRKNCIEELDKAALIFQNYPQLKPENYTYYLIRKASYYRIFDDHKTAFKIAVEAEKYAENVNDKKNGAVLNIALGFNSFENPDQSLRYFQKALKIYKNYRNYNGTAAVYNNISKFYIEQNSYKTAEQYADSAISLVPEVDVFYIIAEVYGTKSKILEHQKNYSAAFNNYKMATEWNEKSDVEQRDLKVQELDLLYNYEKNKIHENELETTMATTQKWNSLLSVLISLLLIFILLLLYSLGLISRNNKKIKLQKQSIFEKNAVLKRNIQEKEFLVRELNHRVKNNLAVILSLVGFQRDETLNVLYKHKFEQLYLRIHTIALGHNLFSYHLNSFEKSTVEIKEYSEKIYESHKAGFPKALEIENNVEELFLPVDKGLSYGLLLNELLTNSLKHAVPTEGEPLKISLTIKDKNGMAEMKYCDNGIYFGISEDEKSLGHFIIDAMVQQLDGTVKREESCYKIIFSVNAEASPEAEKIITLTR
ncbi:MAG: tetratricopeptide repeat protein [Kaistella sp.]|nr:tetratricopeptide repeat protein [Kaistella sp.]